MKSYKEEFSLATRIAEAEKMKQKNPSGVPVIVEKAAHARLPPLDKKRYMALRDQTVGQFYQQIRKRIKLRPEEALFFFVKNTIPSTMMTMAQLHDAYKEEDDCVYLVYSDESVYGDKK